MEGKIEKWYLVCITTLNFWINSSVPLNLTSHDNSTTRLNVRNFSEQVEAKKECVADSVPPPEGCEKRKETEVMLKTEIEKLNDMVEQLTEKKDTLEVSIEISKSSAPIL